MSPPLAAGERVRRLSRHRTELSTHPRALASPRHVAFAGGALWPTFEEPQGLELGELAVTSAGSPDLDLPIEDLDLSERPRNCLKRAQVNSVGELVTKTEDDLLAITNFGQKSLDEVIAKLDERGLSLRTKD